MKHLLPDVRAWYFGHFCGTLQNMFCWIFICVGEWLDIFHADLTRRFHGWFVSFRCYFRHFRWSHSDFLLVFMHLSNKVSTVWPKFWFFCRGNKPSDRVHWNWTWLSLKGLARLRRTFLKLQVNLDEPHWASRRRKFKPIINPKVTILGPTNKVKYWRNFHEILFSSVSIIVFMVWCEVIIHQEPCTWPH